MLEKKRGIGNRLVPVCKNRIPHPLCEICRNRETFCESPAKFRHKKVLIGVLEHEAIRHALPVLIAALLGLTAFSAAVGASGLRSPI